MRGYFGVAIYQPKNSINIGTLWRSANIFGANFIATIGPRYKHQASDTLKTTRHIPLFEYVSFGDFKSKLPVGCQLIGIELTESAHILGAKPHPHQACYLLGSEDNGLPDSVLDECHSVWKIFGERSLNVSVAGSIVIHDRIQKLKQHELTVEGK